MHDCQRTAVVVLGMHRSGTSAIARVLSLLGCDLPRNLMQASPSNPTGHWESESIRILNDEILDSFDSTWFDWVGFDDQLGDHARFELLVTQAMQVLESDYAGSARFVIKDPRMCRLAPIWLEALRRSGVNVIVILAVRNPWAVSASLQSRNAYDADACLLVWLRHVVDAERFSRQYDRLIVAYEDLIQSPVQIAAKCRQRIAPLEVASDARKVAQIAEFLDRKLHHFPAVSADPDDRQPINTLALRLYRGLARLGSEMADATDYAEFEQARFILDLCGSIHRKYLATTEHQLLDRIYKLENEVRKLMELRHE